MLHEIWIYPPLAFARLGASDTPMDNFHWADNDYAARGTAETVIRPAKSLTVAEDGTVGVHEPDRIVFKDGEAFRPVCPFFEVHGRWTVDGTEHEGPITPDVLAACGLPSDALSWRVEAGNDKAYHYTLSEADRVAAAVDIPAGDFAKKPLEGRSPEGAGEPLVLADAPIPFGHVQACRPAGDFTTFRLRLTPGKGDVYAPTDIADRDLSALFKPYEDPAAFLARVHAILNPKADWPSWNPAVKGDYRTTPGLLFAQTPAPASLGFLDDVCDGLVTCRIAGAGEGGRGVKAFARFSCCPPDFQPDRRPFVSIADGLTDLVDRRAVFASAYVADNWEETEAEIADLMQRVKETMGASNLDIQNERSQVANQRSGRPTWPFEPQDTRAGDPLPLTEWGRRHHSRFLAYQVFKKLMHQRPDTFERWIRDPTEVVPFFDNQMPALMRGSTGNPMALTQRQYFLMKHWLDHMAAEPGDARATAAEDRP